MIVREEERERGRGRERGTENEQKRGGANVERENGEETGKATKTSERCRGYLALFDTFASDDSSPFAVPSPLSQRACQRDPCTIRVTAEGMMAATVDAVIQPCSNAAEYSHG